MPSHRRADFAREYLVDLNAEAAALRAGYTATYARKKAHALLKAPDVAALVQAGMEQRAKRVEITQDKVLSDLEDARTGAMAKEDYGSAIKASHLQGKHLGMFKEQVEHSGTIDHVVKGMSDADLDARIRKLLPEAGIDPAS